MEIFNININNKFIKNAFWRCLEIALFLLLPFTAASASESIDFNAMLSSLQRNMGPVITLTKAIAYVLGFWSIISGITELKAIGQSQGSAASGLGGPLVRLAIGVALIYFPSTINTAVSTLWGSGSTILTYPVNPGDPFGPAKQGALVLVQAVGWISFVKGFVTLGHSTQQGAQQGTVGKGVIHIIGGILAINIVATLKVIGNSLGITII